MKKDKLQKLVESSGFTPHKKTIDILRDNKWELLISPYYYDNISNSVKEIDLIAEKQFTSNGSWSDSSVQINVQLFIECKHIKQEILLWFDDKNLDRAVEKIEKSIDLQILHKRSAADMTTDKLHYLKPDKVAKLFSANANQEDVIYKALTQSINAQLYYDQWYDQPLHFGFHDYREVSKKILKYPLIVCDNFSNLNEIEFGEDATKYSAKSIDKHFQIETNYTFLDKDKSAQSEYFLVDLLDVDDIGVFLAELDKEVNSIMHAVDLKRF